MDIYSPFLDFPYLDFWMGLNLKRTGLEQFVMVVSKTKQGYWRFLLLSVLFRHHSSWIIEQKLLTFFIPALSSSPPEILHTDKISTTAFLQMISFTLYLAYYRMCYNITILQWVVGICLEVNQRRSVGTLRLGALCSWRDIFSINGGWLGPRVLGPLVRDVTFFGSKEFRWVSV